MCVSARYILERGEPTIELYNSCSYDVTADVHIYIETDGKSRYSLVYSTSVDLDKNEKTSITLSKSFTGRVFIEYRWGFKGASPRFGLGSLVVDIGSGGILTPHSNR